MISDEGQNFLNGVLDGLEDMDDYDLLSEDAKRHFLQGFLEDHPDNESLEKFKSLPMDEQVQSELRLALDSSESYSSLIASLTAPTVSCSQEPKIGETRRVLSCKRHSPQ